jgi:hypothetical protein
LTRSGDHGPAREPAPDPSTPPELAPILAGLSGEICRPLELLRSGIDRLLDDPTRPITEAERVQARTMLGLCDDLGRLTRECLEGAKPDISSG